MYCSLPINSYHPKWENEATEEKKYCAFMPYMPCIFIFAFYDWSKRHKCQVGILDVIQKCETLVGMELTASS